MKIYIKTTLSKQDRAVRVVQKHLRETPDSNFNIVSLARKYKVPVFTDYEPLLRLWQAYAQDLLFGENKNPNLNMVLPKTAAMDFNGSYLTVIEARNLHLIGMSGIVLYDAQHLFMVVTRQHEYQNGLLSAAQMVGGLRVIPKRGTLFKFTVENDGHDVDFTILGLRFELRSVDRSTKKFKNHSVEDIY